MDCGLVNRDNMAARAQDPVPIIVHDRLWWTNRGIEQYFGITIPDEEADRIKSVSDAIRYIIGHRGEAA